MFILLECYFKTSTKNISQTLKSKLFYIQSAYSLGKLRYDIIKEKFYEGQEGKIGPVWRVGTNRRGDDIRKGEGGEYGGNTMYSFMKMEH
jgi:hypothetical protein